MLSATNTAFAGPWGVTFARNLTPDEAARAAAAIGFPVVLKGLVHSGDADAMAAATRVILTIQLAVVLLILLGGIFVLEALSVITGYVPPEYGYKAGGVIEVRTSA